MERQRNGNGAPPNGSPPLSLPFPSWSARQVILATLAVLGVALGFVLLYRFYMVVFIFFVAFALEVATRPVVVWLERRGVRRWLGVLLLYLLLLGLIGLIAWLVAPLIAQQVGTIVDRLPDYYQQARDWLQMAPNRLLRSVGSALPLELSLPALMPATPGAPPANDPWTTVRLAGQGIFVTLVIFALAFYWTLEGEVIMRRIVLRIPMARREQARALIAEMESKIGGYFRGQAILCVIVGVMSMVAFFVLGVPYALVLGVLMGIFEAIPVIGPTLGAVPAVVMTLAAAPDKVIWVVVILVAIQVLENNLLVPRVMDQSVGVNAIISILAITAFGLLFGLGGAILAIPLAAIVQIILNRVLFDLPIPEDVITAPTTPGDSTRRDRVTVLRLETQELLQDVRKQVRATDDGETAETGERSEAVEDMLESIVQDLDNLLLEMEGERA